MQTKKDYTREKIIEIAKRVFLKNGYAKTSMRDIAKGVGIGVSNIYNYFNSKDELFRLFHHPTRTISKRTSPTLVASLASTPMSPWVSPQIGPRAGWHSASPWLSKKMAWNLSITLLC